MLKQVVIKLTKRIYKPKSYTEFYTEFHGVFTNQNSVTP